MHGQQASNTAGKIIRKFKEPEPSYEDKWFVTYPLIQANRHKSERQVKQLEVP